MPDQPHGLTKIICTLGPASADEATIEQLVRNGMAVARLNFSHGDHAFHKRMIQRLRRVSRRVGRPVGILQDLSGPKIRVGRIKDGAVEIVDGARLKIVPHDILGDASTISASPPELIPELRKGDQIFIDDGMLRLEVTRAGRHEIEAVVVKGGTLRERKGINLPTSNLSLPSLTPKDIADLEFGIALGIDFVALSFVRSANDIAVLRGEVRRREADIPIIAKLEKPQAIKKLGDILQAADAVMVARGDLGVETPIDQVPTLQKNIIATAAEMLKPVITATQMLESMTQHPIPTRAEVSDVANAIIDGTDAVMLSAETASGKYPVEAVSMMSRIICSTEASMRERLQPKFDLVGRPAVEFANAISESAVDMAREIDATLIACFTQTGLSARLVSKQKSPVPVYAFTPHPEILNRMTLLRGVRPVAVPHFRSVDQMIIDVEKILKKLGLVSTGDRVVIVASAPVHIHGDTNMLKLHTIA